MIIFQRESFIKKAPKMPLGNIPVCDQSHGGRGGMPPHKRFLMRHNFWGATKASLGFHQNIHRFSLMWPRQMIHNPTGSKKKLRFQMVRAGGYKPQRVVRRNSVGTKKCIDERFPGMGGAHKLPSNFHEKHATLLTRSVWKHLSSLNPKYGTPHTRGPWDSHPSRIPTPP